MDWQRSSKRNHKCEKTKVKHHLGKNTIFWKHFHLKEHRKQWRTRQTAHRFDRPIARKSRLKSLVTSQLVPNWYELWRHRQSQRQFFSDRMIVSMCGLWGSSLFSEPFLMTMFLTVFKISYSFLPRGRVWLWSGALSPLSVQHRQSGLHMRASIAYAPDLKRLCRLPYRRFPDIISGSLSAESWGSLAPPRSARTI